MSWDVAVILSCTLPSLLLVLGLIRLRKHLKDTKYLRRAARILSREARGKHAKRRGPRRRLRAWLWFRRRQSPGDFARWLGAWERTADHRIASGAQPPPVQKRAPEPPPTVMHHHTAIPQPFPGVNTAVKFSKGADLDAVQRALLQSLRTSGNHVSVLQDSMTITPAADPANMVREYHEATEKVRPKAAAEVSLVGRSAWASMALRRFRMRMIREEVAELELEVLHGTDLGAVAKELADAAYTLYGLAYFLGIDLNHALGLVHTSNMTKLRDPRFDEHGKLIKGPSYIPPVMTPALPEWAQVNPADYPHRTDT